MECECPLVYIWWPTVLPEVLAEIGWYPLPKCREMVAYFLLVANNSSRSSTSTSTTTATLASAVETPAAIAPNEVEDAVWRNNTAKVPGIDQVTIRVWRELWPVVVYKVLKLYQASLKSPNSCARLLQHGQFTPFKAFTQVTPPILD